MTAHVNIDYVVARPGMPRCRACSLLGISRFVRLTLRCQPILANHLNVLIHGHMIFLSVKVYERLVLQATLALLTKPLVDEASLL